MSRLNKKTPVDFMLDATLSSTITERLPQREMTCAEAFILAKDLDISEHLLGHYADHLHIRLIRCQIGLFGQGKGKKKLIETLDHMDVTLEQAILSRVTDNTICCEQVFDIAKNLDISKVMVGSACETLGIRIKHCRFGAF